VNLRPARFLLLSLGSAIVACSPSHDSGDSESQATPSVLGSGLRIRDVVDPAVKKAGAQVYISGAQTLAVDTFDETKAGGSSIGTVYVQDPGSTAPFSGTSIYQAAFVPSNLRIAPGDLLDLRGPFTESSAIGTTKFTPPTVLAQMFRPTVTFRYEAALGAPLGINVNDLNDYATGRQWLNMLVTVNDVTIAEPPTLASGRVNGKLIPGDRNVPSISNELFDLKETSIPAGTKIKSLTGIVTWFFSYHIAPRSPDDIVFAE